MQSIAHVPWPSLGSKYIQQFLLNPRTLCGLLCGTPNVNSENWVVEEYILTY